MRRVVRKRREIRRGAAAPRSGAVPIMPRDDRPEFPAVALRPLIAAYTATSGSTWNRTTRRKHTDDDGVARVPHTARLRRAPADPPEGDERRPLAPRGVRAPGRHGDLVGEQRGDVRPAPALARDLARRRGVPRARPVPAVEVADGPQPAPPPRGGPDEYATLEDLRVLERGCAGSTSLDLRDRAIVSVLVTTAARNSSVRLLLASDVTSSARSSGSAGRRAAGPSRRRSIRRPGRSSPTTWSGGGRRSRRASGRRRAPSSW